MGLLTGVLDGAEPLIHGEGIRLVALCRVERALPLDDWLSLD
jgi:hypothetical protein